MFLTIVDWLNNNQGVADWVGGLGSIGAIGGVWWQSKKERDNIIEQIRHDEKVNSDRLKEENKNNLIQNWRIYQGHLQNTRTVLMTFNKVIISAYKEHKDFRDRDILFLSESVRSLLKSLESSMQAISMYKTVAKVSDDSIKIDINYSYSVIQPAYYLQLALNSQLEFSERNKSVHKNICEMYNGIFFYTSKILTPEIECIDEEISA